MNDAPYKKSGLQTPHPQHAGIDDASVPAMAVQQGTVHTWGPDVAERIVTEGGGAAAAADLARMVDDGHTLGQ